MSDTATQPTETPAAPPAEAPTKAASAKVASVGPSGRPATTRTIVHGSVVAEPTRNENAQVRTLSSSSPSAPRSFTDHQKQMLANLDKHGDVRGAAEDKSATEASSPAVGAEAAKAAEATKPEAKVETPPEPAKPAADPDLTAKVERLTEHNKRLAAENERLTGRAAKAEPDARTKSLDEIERSFTTAPYAAIRKLVALNAGIEDPNHADVDQIMAGLYAEWTGNELKVPMDAGQRALIESKRNRLLIERDKRDQAAAAKAAEDKAAEDAQTQKHADVSRQLGEHLDTSKHAERFPLLMKHSKTFDNAAPGELLFAAIRRGIAAGEFDSKTPDKTLIEHYSKEIETHYQAIRDKFVAASQTSTAAPTQATVPSTENKADATDKGARTITNASASVAPPAPPAKPTSPAPTDKPNGKKWRTENERRQQLAKHYFPDD